MASGGVSETLHVQIVNLGKAKQNKKPPAAKRGRWVRDVSDADQLQKSIAITVDDLCFTKCLNTIIDICMPFCSECLVKFSGVIFAILNAGGHGLLGRC